MHLQHSKSDGINMLIVLLKVHDEREIDRVIGIDGIQLIGINNRNLGMTLFIWFSYKFRWHILYNNLGVFVESKTCPVQKQK